MIGSYEQANARYARQDDEPQRWHEAGVCDSCRLSLRRYFWMDYRYEAYPDDHAVEMVDGTLRCGPCYEKGRRRAEAKPEQRRLSAWESANRTRSMGP